MKQHTATTVEATINILHDHQMLQTTIPTAPGWHVKVDNRPVTVKKSLGIFMAMPLKPGQHVITMRYIPPLLGWGAVITVTGLCLTACWYVVDKRRFSRHLVSRR